VGAAAAAGRLVVGAGGGEMHPGDFHPHGPGEHGMTLAQRERMLRGRAGSGSGGGLDGYEAMRGLEGPGISPTHAGAGHGSGGAWVNPETGEWDGYDPNALAGMPAPGHHLHGGGGGGGGGGGYGVGASGRDRDLAAMTRSLEQYDEDLELQVRALSLRSFTTPLSLSL